VVNVDWSRAACRNLDRDMFFDKDRAAKAIAVCELCQVRLDCLTWALETRQEYGVWGGLTEDARRVLVYRKTRVRCPGCRSHEVYASPTGRGQICRACGLSWLS